MQVVFTAHAAQRIFERNLDIEDVEQVALLGFSGNMPLHVVRADDKASNCCHIITVYVPDTAVWRSDFKTRR